MAVPVYVGWDSREDEAFQVCDFSLRRNASVPVDVHAIVLSKLRDSGLYTRPTEKRDGQLWDVISEAPMSTEFAISRFFVPLLAKNDGIKEGWAIFCDCDFLWLGDVAELVAEADPAKALCCVQHKHEPKETTKMDGQLQVLYARKNWSSMMLFNLAHPAHDRLTLEMLNSVPGRDLHRFCWLEDDEIGAVAPDWNWLEGWSPLGDKTPRVIHYTRGGPWMEGWKDVQFGDLWIQEYQRMLEAKKSAAE